MPKTKPTKKVSTEDDLPLVEKEGVLMVPYKYSNKLTMMLHTEMAAGQFDDKPFRLIIDIGFRCMRVEYEDRHIDIGTEDLAKALLNCISSLNKTCRTASTVRKKK